MKYRIFETAESSEPIKELDSEKKFIHFLLSKAEEFEEFQLDWVCGPEDTEDLSMEMDLCVDDLELNYYSNLVQTKEFPVLGILKYDCEAKILTLPEISWPALAQELLQLHVESEES